MGAKGTLKQVDPLEHYYIYIFELVNVPPVLRRSLFGKVRFDAERAVVTQWQNELSEHFVEAYRMQVKVLRGD